MRMGVVALAAVLLGSAAWADGTGQSGVLQYPAAFFASARPSTAYDMISRVPGFVFDSGKDARGFAGTAGNVLIDGERPTAKTNDLQSILTRIPASDVDHIELIRGGAQGIDMQGQAVVANVVRKTSAATQIVLDLANNIWTDGHMVPSASVQLTHRAGPATYEFSVETSDSYDDSVGHGFYNVTDVAASTSHRYDMRYKNMGIGWTTSGAAAVPLWGGQFKANFTYQDSPDRSVNSYFSTTDNFSISDSSGTKKGEAGLHWTGPVGGAELEALVLQRFERDTDRQLQDAIGDAETFIQRNRTAESIVRTTLRYPPSTELTFEGGWEGAYNQLDGATAYSVNGTPVALPSGTVNVDEKRTELFAQTTWNFAPAWKLEAGSRFEYSVISDASQSREFFYPKPRVLLSWSPTDASQVRVRAERVLGQLDFSNFVASSNMTASGVFAGNPNLSPDRHWQYEIAFEQHFWEKGAISLSLQHEEISGVLDYIPIVGPSGSYSAPGNIGNGHRNFIDLETTWPLDRLGMPGGRFKTTTQWRLSGVRDPATGDTRMISSDRPRNFRAWLSQDVDSLKSTWSIFAYSCWHESYYRPFQLRQRKTIPTYFEFEWDYHPTENWMFTAAVKNPTRFSYDDINTSYPALRGTAGPSEITEYKVKSQARLYLEIRHSL